MDVSTRSQAGLGSRYTLEKATYACTVLRDKSLARTHHSTAQHSTTSTTLKAHRAIRPIIATAIARRELPTVD